MLYLTALILYLQLLTNFMIKPKSFLLCVLSGCDDAVWAGVDVN